MRREYPLMYNLTTQFQGCSILFHQIVNGEEADALKEWPPKYRMAGILNGPCDGFSHSLTPVAGKFSPQSYTRYFLSL